MKNRPSVKSWLPIAAALLSLAFVHAADVNLTFDTPDQFRTNFNVFVHAGDNNAANKVIPGTDPTSRYVEAAGGGIGGSRALDITSGTDSTAIYTTASYDFSYDGATLQASLFFKLLNYSSTSTGRPLQLGFVNENTSSLNNNTGHAFMSLRPNSRNGTSLNVQFHAQHKTAAGGTTGPDSIGPTLTLVAGHWYKLTVTFKNITATAANSFEVSGALDDYGTNGTAFVANMETIDPIQLVNADMTSDNAVWGALRGSNSYADLYENFSLVVPDPNSFPPTVSGMTPAHSSLYNAADAGLAFNVTTVSPNTITNITLTLNGEAIPAADLSITGDDQNKAVTYSKLKTNVFYIAQALAIDSRGQETFMTWWFDTFVVANAFELEAEYYNFQSGQFIDIPELSYNTGPANYFNQLATEGIDTHQISTNTSTTSLPFREGDIVGTQVTGDAKRQKFLDVSMEDYNVGWIAAGEWLNYTHTFTNQSWQVYARLANSTTNPMSASLDEVTSGASTVNQVTAPLGQFSAAGTAGNQLYTWVPLADAFGRPVSIRTTAGAQTLRFTALISSFNFNYLLFVPTAAASTQPVITAVYPLPGATAVVPDVTVTATIANRDSSVSVGSIKLFLNGTQVAATATATAYGATVSYRPANFIAFGTTNTVRLTFDDSASKSVTNEWQFVTVTHLTLVPASFAKPADAGLLSGFAVRTVQGPATPTLSNSVERVEAQLAGRLTNASIYVTTESSGSDVPTVINYAQDTNNMGNFNPNDLIPGMGTHTDNIAMEVVTYLQLNRGSYRFGVAKDDGCRVTTGPVPGDTNLVLGVSPSNGEFTFDFLVETNGLYPFRLVYYEGNGGAGVEWYAVNLVTGERTLINNTNSTIKAYRTISGMPNPVTITKQPPAALTWPANNRATLTVEATAPGVTYPYVLMYQWQKNGVDIPSATRPAYTTPILTMSDSATYKCVVTLPGYESTNTANIQLTVVQDVTPPTVVKVIGSKTFDTVTVSFSEPVEPSSAQTTSNYSLTGDLTIFGAIVDDTGTNVVLSTSPQTQGNTYTLTVNGVKDRANLNANVTQTFQTFSIVPGYLVREVYTGITGGSTVDLLTGSTKFLNNQPDVVGAVALFETPSNYADNYGQRVWGYIVAPEDGSYTFYIASDDSSELWLSTDESPLNKIPIATVNGNTGSREWTKYESQTSAPIILQKGNRYYIEALHKEGTGSDNLAVAWTLPSQAGLTNSTNVILSANIAALGNPETTTLQITQQPTNMTAVQNRQVTFQIAANGSSELGTNVIYQWQREGTNIAGANNASYTLRLAQLGDSGARFKCVAILGGKMLSSDEAVLTVTADKEAPKVSLITCMSGSTWVTVSFDEWVDAASATNPAHYTVAGATVTQAVLMQSKRTVSLTTSVPVSAGASVTVTGVADLAGNALTSASAPAIAPTYAINFQITTAAVVAGYRPDYGYVYGLQTNGLTYGWDLVSTNWTRERNSTNSLDKRYDTLIHMQRGAGSVWEIEVPNGDYKVYLVAGDPSNFDEILRINVEDVLTVDFIPTTTDRFMDGMAAVTVTDGKLTVSNAPGSSNNKICFLEIYAASTPPSPKMTLGLQGGTLTIRWPTEAIGFKLQSTPVLPATTWQDVTGSEATNSVSVTIGTGNQYFRLKK
jgi:hypothetical protein